MGDSLLSCDWKIADAKNKIAALVPSLPTQNRSFTLGAANMIWYKDPLLICHDLCYIKVAIKFPTVKYDEKMTGVIGFKFSDITN